MKTKTLSILAILLLSFFVFSCEREIEIELDQSEESIVIEGIIEAGGNPRVLVSKNRGFFNDFPSDIAALLDTFILQDAVVSVSDGQTTYPLTFVFNPFEYPFAYYTTSALVGEVGKTYLLTVQALGKTATARTTIPPPVPVDSLYFGLNVFDVDEDSLGFLYAIYQDPDTLGNAYRLYAKKSSETQYFPVNGAITNDEFINGRLVTFFSGQSDKPFGVQDTFIEQDFFYRLGDTIQIKFCSIGIREFEFYNTFEAALGTNGNPFASPIIIKTNIEGGLGVWCGQSYFSDTLIATN
jgi:hypothetical protein